MVSFFALEPHRSCAGCLIVLSTFVFAAPVPRVRAWMPPQRLVGNGWLLARRASYAVQLLRGRNGLNVVVWLFTHF